ncbi:hypothetical protein RHSIM_Rhsim11G0003200 [Rhododendron simsii]|uniref:DUF4218 domain-containing protein n=1 Tax=Rhododendron simsii TaxID=118357 RepID=A0A834G6Z7_RHOSS|nr:hypothetical protein RHSIM_Rhsim11G0003200 [Rhododendron simsii]
MFLKFQIKLLPEGNLVPKNTYEARKLLSSLGLSYKLIDAYINDCILFWKENAALDRCLKCNVSRYKINCARVKKIARKILRYFPLTPRLKRLFMSRAIAESMRWHINNPPDGKESRHLAHSDEWKEFDVKHPEFACEARNVRLGIATDGFNPFRDKQPGIDIDDYLRPLVDELQELWHTERRKRLANNGKLESRKRSLELPVEKIQEQLKNVSGVIFGKNPATKKRKRHKPNWTKRSILYELTYVEDRKLLHNIDVMHCEKNFSENIVGTMLGIDGKNKDTDKARKDLEDKGIRKDLWLTQRPDGLYVKPCASFALTLKEREAFFEFLKSVKYPDGYAANISRSVNATNGRLTGLKSHEYHILIQQILPIGMRGFVDKEISTTLFELGSFFQDLCSKTLRRNELEKLEERIVLILCKLEKIFPSAFLDVTFHLAVHLPREAILGGPFVSNRARPEGSIVEAYIVKECITFCSMYLNEVETVHNRPQRNEDFGECRKGYTVFTETARPFGLVTRNGEMSQELRDVAHWFILLNSPEIEEYLEYGTQKTVACSKWTKHNQCATKSLSQVVQRESKILEILLEMQVNQLRANKSTEATDELWSLANGPNLLVKEHYGCITNGLRFHTREVDDHLRSQNSCVLAHGDREGKMHNYYGHLIKVWEFEYMFFYLNDTKWGEPWQVVQLVKQRGVFDLPKVGDGEPLDSLECTDAFQQESMTSGVPIDIEGNIRFRREDAEVEVIAGVGPLHETTENLTDDEVDEEHEIIGEDINDKAGEDDEISDADMDPNMEYDA